MISIDGSDRVGVAVREGRADIGFIFYAPPDRELVMVFKVRAPRIAAMSAQHPLAGKSKVSLSECAAYPIAAPMQNTVGQAANAASRSLIHEPGGRGTFVPSHRRLFQAAVVALLMVVLFAHHLTLPICTWRTLGDRGGAHP